MLNKSKTIPKGWQKKQIKDLLDYERPDKYIVESDRYIKTGTPVLTANKSFILGYTDEKEGIYKDLPVIVFDDFTTDSKYTDFSFKVKLSAIKLLKNKEGVDLRFVYEKMKSITFPTGSHKRYYISQYQNMEVLVPPLTEQKKIAEILSSVDEEIQKTDEIVSSTEQLKHGLMRQLLIKGGKKKINEVVEINPTLIDPLKKPEDKIYYIDISSVKENVITGVKEFLGIEAPSRAKRLLSKDDIILSTVRPNLRGFAYLTDKYESCVGSTGFCVLRAKKLNPKFLYYVISDYKFTNYLVGKTTGSNYPAVNPTDIGEYEFNLPEKNEQEEIADILSVIDEKILINKKLRSALELLKKGLMQDLLTGKKRTI